MLFYCEHNYYPREEVITLVVLLLPQGGGHHPCCFIVTPQEEVITLERILLQTIKFDLQVDHPYSWLLKFAKLLKGQHVPDIYSLLNAFVLVKRFGAKNEMITRAK